MRKRNNLLYVIAVTIILYLYNNYYVAADVTSSMVINVHDGDTITVLDQAHNKTKIRLAEIDAPELKQPFGTKAKQELSNLVLGKNVDIVVNDTDRYGRSVAHISLQDKDINAELVKRGVAWVYRDYSKDPNLIAFEAAAKQDHLGLWKLPENERLPPWQWRKQQKLQRQKKSVAQ